MLNVFLNAHLLYMKKVVGFITVPTVAGTDPKYTDRGNSTISSNHISFIEPLEWTAIPYQSSHEELDRFLDTIHLFYIPSGNIGAHESAKYLNNIYYCVGKIKEFNRSGIYFPIWSVCMGIQLLLAVENRTYHHGDFLNRYDSRGFKTNLPQVNRGRITDSFSHDEKIAMETTIDKLHNHDFGISPKMFESTNIKKNYVIIHMNVDRNGSQFIGTVEHNKYPFYGFQWHPEASPNCHMFSRFFHSEINKTPNKPLPKQFNKGHLYDCKLYSFNTYENCYFFK